MTSYMYLFVRDLIKCVGVFLEYTCFQVDSRNLTNLEDFIFILCTTNRD